MGAAHEGAAQQAGACSWLYLEKQSWGSSMPQAQGLGHPQAEGCTFKPWSQKMVLLLPPLCAPFPCTPVHTGPPQP